MEPHNKLRKICVSNVFSCFIWMWYMFTNLATIPKKMQMKGRRQKRIYNKNTFLKSLNLICDQWLRRIQPLRNPPTPPKWATIAWLLTSRRGQGAVLSSQFLEVVLRVHGSAMAELRLNFHLKRRKLPHVVSIFEFSDEKWHSFLSKV